VGIFHSATNIGKISYFSSMAEQEIIKHTKAIVELSTNNKKPWQHRVKEIIGEVLIIVFAVSISIWFHNWSESWKDRGEEKAFLEGLKTDLQADMKEMIGDRASYAQGLKGVAYFEKVGAGLPLDLDSISHYSDIFFGNIQISPRVSRFEALKGSGRLDIIRNKELLVHITDLYTKDFPQIIKVNEYFDKLRADGFFPFISDRLQMDAAGNGTNWQEILRAPKMRLMFELAEGATASVEDYTRGIDKCQLILREIDKALN
jgi:hypothetical protein